MEDKNQKIQFIQHHVPALKAGTYELKLGQTVSAGTDTLKEDIQQTFEVRGERFSLQAGAINSFYPAGQSVGNSALNLPHIVLNDSTYPWQRTTRKGSNATWLALLVFDKDEIGLVNSQTVKLDNLDEFGRGDLKDLLAKNESGSDECNIIRVPEQLLKKLMPTQNDLKLLAHIREVENESKGDGQFKKGETSRLSVLTANRLPTAGGKNTVHLVSVENYYDEAYKVIDDRVTFVTLAIWHFDTADIHQNFRYRMKEVLKNSGTLGAEIKEDYSVVLKNMLESGHALIPHHMRRGDNTVSMYHGPFVPYSEKPASTSTEIAPVELPVLFSDNLIRYHSDLGTMDVSYASIWQIGRLLSLQKKTYASALSKWKNRRKEVEVREAQKRLIEGHLGELSEKKSFQNDDADTLALENEIVDWLGNLLRYQNIPLQYLIPDVTWLPPNSLRFYSVDERWTKALLDGAFSIGRTTRRDLERDKEDLAGFLKKARTRLDEYRGNKSSSKKQSGFLLRSTILKQWPGTEIVAYGKGQVRLPMLSMEDLGHDITRCLFAGSVEELAFNQPPEALHFGFSESIGSRKNGNELKLEKKLRDEDGNLLKGKKLTEIEFKSKEKRVINMWKLAYSKKPESGICACLGIENDPKKFTSARFAMQLVENADQVRCKRGKRENESK